MNVACERFSLSCCFLHPDKPYHLELVDLVRFNSQGKIAQMKIFKDTAHAHKHVDEDESEAKQGK